MARTIDKTKKRKKILDRYHGKETKFKYFANKGTNILGQYITTNIYDVNRNLKHRDKLSIYIGCSEAQIIIERNSVLFYISHEEFLNAYASNEIKPDISKGLITVKCRECGRELYAKKINMFMCFDCEIKKYNTGKKIRDELKIIRM